MLIGIALTINKIINLLLQVQEYSIEAKPL